jgi:hypothetical protein
MWKIINLKLLLKKIFRKAHIFFHFFTKIRTWSSSRARSTGAATRPGPPPPLCAATWSWLLPPGHPIFPIFTQFDFNLEI